MNVYDIEVLERIYFASFYQTICVVADSPQDAVDGMMRTYPDIELDDVKSITLHAKDVILYRAEPVAEEDPEQRK